MARDGFITIKNAKIFSRNFSGKEGKFNPEGRRNFCVHIENIQDAEAMQNDGWNVRWLEPRDDGGVRQPFIQVAVSYKNIPPKVILVSKKGQTRLEEEEVGMLDWAEIENIDLTINPSHWEMPNGSKGIKAYLRSAYVTIYEDELDELYSNVPDSAQSSITDDSVPWD